MKYLLTAVLAVGLLWSGTALAVDGGVVNLWTVGASPSLRVGGYSMQAWFLCDDDSPSSAEECTEFNLETTGGLGADTWEVFLHTVTGCSTGDLVDVFVHDTTGGEEVLLVTLSTTAGQTARQVNNYPPPNFITVKQLAGVDADTGCTSLEVVLKVSFSRKTR